MSRLCLSLQFKEYRTSYRSLNDEIDAS
jgi:hypothetical protein